MSVLSHSSDSASSSNSARTKQPSTSRMVDEKGDDDDGSFQNC